ncbi:MAG: dihydroneopterin aldolase [Campylobacterota bacterium]|nr:dihydroneopterin aldolase [Campylobacterota bacterium]
MKVFIEQLNFKTIIGILPFERVKKQKVIIDISFEYDFKNGQFVDYSKVAYDVKRTMKKEKFELIEDAINSLQKKLIKKYKVRKLFIKISKPDILKDCKVSVSN